MMPDSQTGGVWLSIGNCQSKLKNYKEALFMWEEKVIRDHSDSKYIVDALFYSAYVYTKYLYPKSGDTGQLEKAREYCERALEDKPRTRYRQTLVKRIKSLLKEIERIEEKERE